MSKKLLPLAILSAALFAVSASAGDGHRWGHSLNMTTNNADSDNCADHLTISSDDYSGFARSEEQVTLGNSPLTVKASQNGGIHVRSWDKNEISVKLCRAAAGRSNSEAEAELGRIHLNNSGGHISVDGPDSSNNDDVVWSSVLLINAPRGVTLDLSVHNGGISLKGVNGNITGHAINGGTSLSQTAGNINVEAQNGGISIKDCGGDVKANVQNGGLSIQLGETWNGAGLDARSHNGGLVIEIPKNFQSSMEIAAGNHSSLICQSQACDGGQRNWDDNGRTLRFGSSSPIIHASTVNGGTVIKERGVGKRSEI